jgi:acyl-coenzyme A thioesterase PaaI-like protein
MDSNNAGLSIQDLHSHCFACGKENTSSLHLEFKSSIYGSVTGRCILDEQYQGYPGYVQGGITATILDSAMTNCLFQQGIVAFTVRLNVIYREPVLVDEEIVVEATIVNHRNRVYELEACVIQDSVIKASAVGRFMVRKDAI